ncbi:hypothetical protein LTS15_002670, partial [Exophiala xenobiotica]
IIGNLVTITMLFSDPNLLEIIMEQQTPHDDHVSLSRKGILSFPGNASLDLKNVPRSGMKT